MRLVEFGGEHYNLDHLVRIKPVRDHSGRLQPEALTLCFADGKRVEVRGDELALIRRLIQAKTVPLARFVDEA